MTQETFAIVLTRGEIDRLLTSLANDADALERDALHPDGSADRHLQRLANECDRLAAKIRDQVFIAGGKGRV